MLLNYPSDPVPTIVPDSREYTVQCPDFSQPSEADFIFVSCNWLTKPFSRSFEIHRKSSSIMQRSLNVVVASDKLRDPAFSTVLSEDPGVVP